MKALEYSTSALNVLRHFYKVKAMIFVEGRDDLLFWNNIASKLSVSPVRIEHVGGAEELKKRVEAIIKDDAQIVVAMDADYALLMNTAINHPRIVYTFGYSIENSMYCPKTISDVAGRLARTLNDNTSVVVAYYKDFNEKSKVLLICDLANQRYSKGIHVLGNSSRFLTKRSPYLSKKKIMNYVSSIESSFSDEELAECELLVNKDDREIRWLIKGHFLTNTVINYVKEIVKEESSATHVGISLDHLYSNTIGGCIVCSPEGCEALSNMVSNLERAVASI